MTGSPGGGADDGPPKAGGADEGSSISRFAGVGLQFALSIIVFLYAGQWLDRKLMAAQARDEAARKAKREGTP